MRKEKKKMDEKSIHLTKLSYKKLVNFLLKKYGDVPGDYMTKNYNKRSTITRGNEGLFIHHIDEDKAIMLSNKSFAKKYPFDFQRANRLVYCNLLEHLLLHIKIMEEPKPINKRELVGYGGVFNFIIPQLNDIFNNIKYKQNWQQQVKKNVFNQKKQYFNYLKYLYNFLLSKKGKNYLKYLISDYFLHVSIYNF